jgi:jumonji domain-containing protein 2
MFKVVAPAEWNPRAKGGSYRELIDSKAFTVKKPIEQNISGNGGVFEIINFLQDSKNLSRFERSVKPSDLVAEGKEAFEVERLFWRTLKHSAPIYGADIEGSIFDKGCAWNLNELQTILN